MVVSYLLECPGVIMNFPAKFLDDHIAFCNQ